MRSIALVCLLSTGCAVWQPADPRPNDPTLLHPYATFTNHPVDVKNLNQDPDGDAWMVGGLRLPSDEEFAAFPKLQIKPQGLQAPRLPERVNNATQKYWRGIFTQKHGSCAQASAIAYVYGYEVNRLRDKPANNPHHRYPTHWTYNFVNNGYDRGSWMMWGWEVAKSMGVPSVKQYGTETGFDLRYWPSSYSVYENAVGNRVKDYFVMQVGTHDGLMGLKQYLNDHGDGDGIVGGVVSFAAGWSENYREVKIPEGRYQAGQKLIASFGKVVNHAITFVGYDDEVCHDFNRDGKCTNDKDLTGDGRVDIRDWEVGAFIMANSWGERWGNGGYSYVPYRLVALSPKDGGIYRRSVYGVVPHRDEPMGAMLRVRMQHSDRSKLRFFSGLEDLDGNERLYRYSGLQNSGGQYPLNGSTIEPVEFGLDLRRLVGDGDIDEISEIGLVLDSLGGVGSVESLSVMDYETGRVVGPLTDIDIASTGRTIVAADWADDDGSDPEPEPKTCGVGPVAIGGEDIMVSEHCVYVLDGSDSFDADGEIVSYRWRQIYGPQKLELEGADTPVVTVYIPKVKKNETYWLQLVIVDDSGFKAGDRVKIQVLNRSSDR